MLTREQSPQMTELASRGKEKFTFKANYNDGQYNTNLFAMADLYDDGVVDNYFVSYTNCNGYSHALASITPIVIAAPGEYSPKSLPRSPDGETVYDEAIGMYIKKRSRNIVAPLMEVGFIKGLGGMETVASIPLFQSNLPNRVWIGNSGLSVDPFDIVDLYDEKTEKVRGKAVRAYGDDEVDFLIPLDIFKTVDGATLRISLDESGSERKLTFEVALDSKQVMPTLKIKGKVWEKLVYETNQPIFEFNIPLSNDAPWEHIEKQFHQLDTHDIIMQGIERYIYNTYYPYIRCATVAEEYDIQKSQSQTEGFFV